MRKLFLAVSAFILSLVLLNIPSSGFAQEIFLAPSGYPDVVEQTEPAQLKIAPEYYPVPDRRPPHFSGENHDYSVVLRGNGEAVVTLKVALSNLNPDGSELTAVSLRLPSRILPSDIAAYQITAQGYCMRYAQRPLNPEGIGMPLKYNPGCLEYSEPDYFDYYGGGKYQRAKYNYSLDTLEIFLPKPIQNEKSGAFLVYFRALGFARKNFFGAYKFTIESLKAANAINNLNIGISTDADMFIKGGQGEVGYRYANSEMLMKSPQAKGGGAFASSAIDNVISQIGQGAIVKNAANLAPLESYKVSGIYANSRFKLYGKEIIVSVFGILLVLALITLLARKILKYVRGSALKKEIKSDQTQEDNSIRAVMAAGISFISSLILGGYGILLILLFNYLNYADYQIAMLLRVAAMIISFCVYIVGLFIPGLYYGYKKGMGWGVLTVVLTVVWLIIYFILGLAVFFLFGFKFSNPVYY
ncbi:hypothetical protein A3J20_03295 [Candidatus Gottesmanbacteria bacterium RIFCSPLOWO2_02_FULL_42_29]|uniref:Uncharacterized protein n=2 Tax=Candidatus Gottesmaniibacteriota TaxID=1752720 RepID=A0A1F6BDQ6_9BACT|nr:MAG: hypothetical protein UV09_C0002G0025 [Candidatus Gottesmanbacteria bacterium GW2011_GWA2_42_18]OGG12205.1 MAG: hypothetical protein A2781_04780 [Candidatus Gottesmanbacteria bacterium RIFCSPHIGHO2_01_FULL_42_27]OGG21693.1 MAG: hypothetical protein A3E72_04445 [Candidatus Gottesmanbacteria bacterium RIFCSPHIGHO2_12_FULL_43_26]OGG34232.1 MAG: hypothetical protein A3G68_02910 [Candidatus Gottesmanbacteria bacterium RIFCSPLOWO2_12_FULL_42_10]OGG35030.1 MAG: hypothetical protein A2968_00145 